jgi:hypothetical protein
MNMELGGLPFLKFSPVFKNFRRTFKNSYSKMIKSMIKIQNLFYGLFRFYGKFEVINYVNLRHVKNLSYALMNASV